MALENRTFSYEIMKTLTKLCLALLTLASAASAWEEEEFEVFDLVEEINQNFYDYMELKQAWRTLITRIFHLEVLLIEWSMKIRIVRLLKFEKLTGDCRWCFTRIRTRRRTRRLSSGRVMDR